MINIASNLVRNAQLLPGKTAVIAGSRQLTYRQLDEAASRLANGLRARGVERGDRVALACPNTLFFPIAYYAILKLGAVAVPLNIMLKGSEIAYHLSDSQAHAFLCHEGMPGLPLGAEGQAGFEQAGDCAQLLMIREDGVPDPSRQECVHALMAGQSSEFSAVQTDANDTAVILYTSGTTGTPKGAELSHANLAMNCQCCVGLMKLDSGDVHVVALPLFHTFGQTVQMNAVVQAGASMVLLPRFDPDAVLSAMAQHAVTIFCGVPTMYIGLLNLPGAGERHDLARIAAHLRLGISGGAPMPVTVLQQFEQKFQVIILEGYGLSETSPVATFNHIDMQRIPGSVGQPLAGVEVAIVGEDSRVVADGEVGEITVRGHNVMKGYFRRPEETAQAIRDGWFHTGDLGRRDAQGNVFVVDRLKDMVLRGGFNVYPRELEEVLMTHPAIALVAVIGVPHEVHGEEVQAMVVLKPGEVASGEDIVTWCRERMAAYKYPRVVKVMDSLPMTATGKILKRALRG